MDPDPQHWDNIYIIDAILFSGRLGRGNGLLDEGGEDSPEHLVSSLLGRLRFQVQVQKVSAREMIFFSYGCIADPDPDPPDPPDPHVFGSPGSGSGSTSKRFGSGSGS